MKKLAALLLPLLVLGCAEPTDTTVDAETKTEDTVTTNDVTAPEATTVSFAAGDSVTIAVPDMHCPFVCFPNVKDSLEEMDGVEVVELVPQKEDGKIDDRRVTVKFSGSVEGQMALATLEKNGFPESAFEE